MIKSKITVQLIGLASKTPALTKFPVGKRDRAFIIGNSPPFTGQIWYATQYNNDLDAYLVVDWEGSSNFCQITKVSLQGTSFSTQILWPEQTN